MNAGEWNLHLSAAEYIYLLYIYIFATNGRPRVGEEIGEFARKIKLYRISYSTGDFTVEVNRDI